MGITQEKIIDLNGIWDLIVSVPDHCLSFYFLYCYTKVSR